MLSRLPEIEFELTLEVNDEVVIHRFLRTAASFDAEAMKRAINVAWFRELDRQQEIEDREANA